MNLKDNNFYTLRKLKQESKNIIFVKLEIDTPSETYHHQFSIEPQELNLFLFEYAVFMQELEHHNIDFGYFIQEGDEEAPIEEKNVYLWLKGYPLTSSWFSDCLLDPIVGIELNYIDMEENAFKIDLNDKEIASYVKNNLGENLYWKDVINAPKMLCDKFELEQRLEPNDKKEQIYQGARAKI